MNLHQTFPFRTVTATAGEDPVLGFKKPLQFTRQRRTELLPGQHLASSPQLCIADAAHDRIPPLNEVLPPGIGDYAEAPAGPHVVPGDMKQLFFALLV